MAEMPANGEKQSELPLAQKSMTQSAKSGKKDTATVVTLQ